MNLWVCGCSEGSVWSVQRAGATEDREQHVMDEFVHGRMVTDGVARRQGHPEHEEEKGVVQADGRLTERQIL